MKELTIAPIFYPDECDYLCDAIHDEEDFASAFREISASPTGGRLHIVAGDYYVHPPVVLK